ncbi:hypothetical protein [Streptomyces sp. NPDC001381]|uniref:hypothetical protein n=1 Tax=Streptomyces sp. NPDC001381 TaxID=3364567 RepID=UPI0036A8D251
MTQSGQGEEPSARPAREGIVLPSDGGEPLLPGMTTSGSRPAPQQPNPQPGPYGAETYGQQAPAGGQTWGGPWGPDQQPQAQQQDQGGWPLPADQRPQQQWSTPQPDAWGAGPLPPEGAPSAAPPQPYGQAHVSQPSYGQDPAQAHAPQPSYGQDPAQAHAPQPSYGQDPAQAHVPQPSYGQGAPGVPLPPAVDEGATQYIPPVQAAPVDDGRTQFLPPVSASGPAPGGADEGATQYIPPVGPGALPPEAPAESTHFLGTGGHHHPGPVPGASHADAEATQYIPPVPAQGYPESGDRQPPSGFENLFRGGPAGDGPAGATQQLPRISEPEPPGYGGAPQGYGAGPAARAQQPSYAPPARDDDHGGRGGRTGSRIPLFAAIGVALAVVGVGAGALLAGGGEDDDQGDGNTTVAASAPATEGSASSDAAEQQAVALDKLLADSGSSRASVIAAVANVKACDNLAQAASDLRAAAGQRTELVTKLSGLAVDKLPDHAALTSALTKAWQASAAADNHYAAWADEVAGNRKKACKKGTARTTASTQQGNRESGTASAQKTRAAQLWNAIAKTYGLTQRQPTQL